MDVDQKEQGGGTKTPLLDEIRHKFPTSVETLKEAGIENDINLRWLTREDLNELFPGRENLGLRTDMSAAINKGGTRLDLLGELKGNMLREHQTTRDNMAAIERVKTSMKSISQRFRRHLENDGKGESIAGSPLQPGPRGEAPAQVKSILGEIHTKEPEAVTVLEEADLRSDSDLQALTRNDLKELFDGAKNLKLRKKVHDIIHKQPETNKLLIGFEEIFRDYRAAPTNREETRELMDAMESIVELLEYEHIDAKDVKGVTVKYKVVVSGKTFGAHAQLMDLVRRRTPKEVRLVEDENESQVIIVVCPITSRIVSDVDSAMDAVRDDKQVILAILHHKYEPEPTMCRTSWRGRGNVVLQVNMFFHQTKPGLLDCKENLISAARIKNHLLKVGNYEGGDTDEDTNEDTGEGNSAKMLKKFSDFYQKIPSVSL